MKYYAIISILTVGILLSGGCIQDTEPGENQTQVTVDNEDEISHPIPQPPDIGEPELISLPEKLQNICSGGTTAINSDIDSARFVGCIVTVRKSGINITRTEFVNCRIFFESASDIVFSDNVVRDYPVYEEAAINVFDSKNIVFGHNHIKNNSVGISVAKSQDIKLENNIFDENYQHNAVAMYMSSGEVSGNLFRYNMPHGILVHFIPQHGDTAVYIHDNIFFMNKEDAINFEDWTGAKDQSRIYRNIITKTNWAGINIEYGSWNANILIENNYINTSGYPIENFPENPNAPEGWKNGWEHGIKLEDCSHITITNNTVLDNNENGIDIRNCMNVEIHGNTVTGNDIGIYSHDSPIAIYRDNYVFRNKLDILQED